MKPRIFLPLLGAGALLIATGIAVQIASADERPVLTSEYSEAGFWSSGLIGTFTIRNPSTTPAQDWKLTFGLSDGAKIAGVWNGTLAASGGMYVVTPTAQTKTLPANGSLTVGFTALTNVHAGPLNCLINGKSCKIDKSRPAVDAPNNDVPNNNAPDLNANAQPSKPAPGPNQPGGGKGKGSSEQPSVPTGFSPYVFLPAGDRPPLRAMAEASGSNVLTLLSALPSIGGGCDLKWGGTVDLSSYTKEITDALASKIALIASIGGVGGIDLTQACSTVASLEGQLKRVLALGVRSIDLTLSSGSLGNTVANLNLAQVVKDLKAQFAGLSVTYTLPAGVGSILGDPLSALDTLTAPLAAAKNIGAIIDRVNVLPVDLSAAPGLLNGLLSGLGLGNTIDPLLNLATGLHSKLMNLQGLDASAAWHMLGIVPVIGNSDLLGGSSALLGKVNKLASFVKANGLGLLGFLPLGLDRQCASGGILPINLPVLSCLDAGILPNLFNLTGLFNNALR